MKKILIGLALMLPLTCFAGERTLELLKNDAQLSGTAIGWELEQDYLLEGKQLKQAKAVPKGQTVQLAATMVEAMSNIAFETGFGPDEYPVAYSCTESRTVVFTTASKNEYYQGRGCNLLNKPSA
jgi:hypothetical protein